MSTRPADGERNAISGYSLQYLVAAELAYSEISRGTLEWVHLVDPDAGRVDDIVIGTPGWVDAYQVKWAQAKSTYTLHAFLTPSDQQPSLWKQLSEGWESIQRAYPDRQTRVNFVSNEIASPNDRISDGDGAVFSFQELWSETLAPLSQRLLALDTCLPTHRDALERLRTETGTDVQRFSTYLANCRLQFDRPDPRRALSDDPRKLTELEDIQHLAAYLQRRVIHAKGAVKISNTELLRDMGWEARLSPRFRHEFPIDESLYRPIEPTVGQLRMAIADRSFGYHALLGGPGSGKSTTLSHTLRYAPNIRLISYYAYIKNDPTSGRGEAANFWQDLYIAIRQRGINPLGAVPRSGNEFRAAVAAQFALMADEWKTRGLVTVLLIDGLDHIDREQHPTESLIGQLPLPEQLPPGVIIFLGSQTLNLQGLAPSITAQLKAPGRTFQMGRLTRADTFAMCDAMQQAVVLTPEQKNSVHRLGAGYPLATMYVLGKLSGSAASDVDKVLDEETVFSEDIEALYATYWSTVDGTPTSELLGLLSRLRIPFNIRDAVSWVPGLDAHAFVRLTKHFFHTSDSENWSFFHNSFRQYLLRRTAEDFLETYSDALSKAKHQRLAELAQASAANSTFGREVIYHLFEAGNFSGVLTLATQERMREQYFALRNSNQVFADIALAVRAAGQLQDGLAFVRSVLIDKELREREWSLDNASFRSSIDVFLDNQALLHSIRDQHRLLVPRKQALECAKRLYASGAEEAARGLFDLAEPHDLLSGVEKIKVHEGDRDLLELWLELAVLYRPAPAIADAIGNLSVETYDIDEAQLANEHLRFSLLVELGTAAAKRDETEFRTLLGHPAIAPDADKLVLHVDWNLLQNAPDAARRAAILSRLLHSDRTSHYSDAERVYLAECMRRHSFERERIEAFIQGVAQPPLVDPSTQYRSGSTPSAPAFSERLRYNRLLSSLGQAVAPESAVPWPSDSRQHSAARFERMIVVIANLWGAALADKRYDEDVIRMMLHDALRVYYAVRDNADPGTYWFYYQGLASDYFEYLVMAVAAHGSAQLQAIGLVFDQIWKANEPRATWAADLRRSIATALYKHGDSKERFIGRLDAIAATEVLPDDLGSRLDSLIDAARAWQLAGAPARALELLPRTMQSSFGIAHHKDRQLQEWVGWLDRSVQAGAANPDMECRRFAGLIRSVEALGRGRGVQDATSNLLAIATRADPSLGLHLREELFASGTASYGAACQGVIYGLLDRPDCDAAQITQFLTSVGAAAEMPFVEKLTGKLVEVMIKQHSGSETIELLRPLVTAVLTDEFKSARGPWLRTMSRTLTKHGIDWPELGELTRNQPEEYRGTPSTVQQRDGSTVVDHELEKRIVDFDSLQLAIEQTEPGSYYSWPNVARDIVSAATISQLQTLEGLLSQLGTGIHLVAAQISNRFRALGDVSKAESIAATYLDTAPPYGWITQFDGGSRLQLANALIKVNSTRRPALFSQLVGDYVRELRNPREIAMDLDEFFPILFTEVPWQALWLEVSNHISQLDEFIQSVAISGASTTEHSATSALVHLAVTDYQLPIQELEIRFIRLLAQWLETPAACDLVLALLESALAHQMDDWQAVVPLLVAAPALRRSEPPRLAALLQHLDASNDISVRMYAAVVRHGRVMPNDLMRDRETSPIAFSMQLPSSAPHGHEIDLPPTAVESMAHLPADPARLFHLYHPQFELLARMTEIEVENLLERAQQIANSIASNYRWGANPEPAIRKFLSAIELKITFRRPRAHIAESALFALISELVDTGLLDPAQVLSTGLALFFDEKLIQSKPVPAPTSWIHPMSEKSLSQTSQDWVQSVEGEVAAQGFHRALPDGYVVLMEYSCFQLHDWEMSHEERIVILREPGAPKLQAKDDVHDIVPGFRFLPAGVYPRTPRPATKTVPVIGSHNFGLRVGPQRWFAINPAFAADQGWRHVGRDDFAWANPKGEIVARTIQWHDGPGPRTPPKLHEVYGEGWLVIAKRDALVTGGRSVWQLDSQITRTALVREDRTRSRASARAFSSEVIHL